MDLVGDGSAPPKVIENEEMFKQLVHGDDVEEIASKILEWGLKMQREKRR